MPRLARPRRSPEDASHASETPPPTTTRHARGAPPGAVEGRRPRPRLPPALARLAGGLLRGGAAESAAAGPGDGTKGAEEGTLGGDERVLVSEVEVNGVDGELAAVAWNAIKMKPNYAYTLREVQEDALRVWDTGYFKAVTPDAGDTRDGVRVAFNLTPNPVMRAVQVQGTNRLPARAITDAFRSMYGRTLNRFEFQAANDAINSWYEMNGVYGKVKEGSTISEQGIVEFSMQEPLVNKVNVTAIQVKKAKADQQNPEIVPSRTKPDVFLRQMTQKPGSHFSLQQARQDIAVVKGLKFVRNANIVPEPIPNKAAMNFSLEVEEHPKKGLNVAGGVTSGGGEGGFSLGGLTTELSWQNLNLFGLGQELSVAVDIDMTADKAWRVYHINPWLRDDQHRTQRKCSLTREKTSAEQTHGRAFRPTEVPYAESQTEHTDVDKIYVQRTGGSIEWTRPLNPQWTATWSAGLSKASLENGKGEVVLNDSYGSPLTYSGLAEDVSAMIRMSASYSKTDPAAGASTGLTMSTEQALQVRPEWLNFVRTRGSLNQKVKLGPMRFKGNLEGGSIAGTLPPYEAFPLGGPYSVRGFEPGQLGSGRHFLSGGLEVQLPVVEAVSLVGFVDYGTDLDSGASVLGDPAGTRNKVGRGYGYGAGVCIETPLSMPVVLLHTRNTATPGKGRFQFYFDGQRG